MQGDVWSRPGSSATVRMGCKRPRVCVGGDLKVLDPEVAFRGVSSWSCWPSSPSLPRPQVGRSCGRAHGGEEVRCESAARRPGHAGRAELWAGWEFGPGGKRGWEGILPPRPLAWHPVSGVTPCGRSWDKGSVSIWRGTGGPVGTVGKQLGLPGLPEFYVLSQTPRIVTRSGQALGGEPTTPVCCQNREGAGPGAL